MGTFRTLMADAILSSCREQESLVRVTSNGTIQVTGERLHMYDTPDESIVKVIRYIKVTDGSDEGKVVIEVGDTPNLDGTVAMYEVDYIGGDLKIDKILAHAE
jgi:hypothetical protein